MEAERRERGVLDFFSSNPIIGLAGSLASIVSVPLAVYLFFASQSHRDLCYFLYPAKAVIVKAGQTSRLSITLGGEPVDRDVIAAQVAFWNEGSQPIRPDHVLSPLVLRTGRDSRLIEARLSKVGRDVSGIALDLTRLGENEVRVNWGILERRDGAVVQLVYLGDTATQVTATATIEGQRELHSIVFADEVSFNARVRRRLGSGLILVVQAAFLAALGRRLLDQYPRHKHRAVLMALAAVALVLGSAYLVASEAVTPVPPFAFK